MCSCVAPYTVILHFARAVRQSRLDPMPARHHVLIRPRRFAGYKAPRWCGRFLRFAMRSLFLFCVTFVTATIALTPLFDVTHSEADILPTSYPVHKRHNQPGQNGTCNVDAQGITFKNSTGDLTVTGAYSGTSTSDQVVSLDIDSGGVAVLQFLANITVAGVIHTKWHFGDGVGAIKDAAFTTQNNSTTGTISGRQIIPFDPNHPNFTFSDWTPVPTANISDQLRLQLSIVPEVIRETIRGCSMFDETGEAGLLLRRQVPGQVDNTRSASACITCVATATITTESAAFSSVSDVPAQLRRSSTSPDATGRVVVAARLRVARPCCWASFRLRAATRVTRASIPPVGAAVNLGFKLAAERPVAHPARLVVTASAARSIATCALLRVGPFAVT